MLSSIESCLGWMLFNVRVLVLLWFTDGRMRSVREMEMMRWMWRWMLLQVARWQFSVALTEARRASGPERQWLLGRLVQQWDSIQRLGGLALRQIDAELLALLRAVIAEEDSINRSELLWKIMGEKPRQRQKFKPLLKDLEAKLRAGVDYRAAEAAMVLTGNPSWVLELNPSYKSVVNFAWPDLGRSHRLRP